MADYSIKRRGANTGNDFGKMNLDRCVNGCFASHSRNPRGKLHLS
jgi:hypothetical protein